MIFFTFQSRLVPIKYEKYIQKTATVALMTFHEIIELMTFLQSGFISPMTCWSWSWAQELCLVYLHKYDILQNHKERNHTALNCILLASWYQHFVRWFGLEIVPAMDWLLYAQCGSWCGPAETTCRSNSIRLLEVTKTPLSCYCNEFRTQSLHFHSHSVKKILKYFDQQCRKLFWFLKI